MIGAVISVLILIGLIAAYIWLLLANGEEDDD